MTKTSQFVPGIGTIEDENSPSPGTRLHLAQTREAVAIACALSDAQAQAMVRATPFGVNRYPQNKRTMDVLYKLKLVGEPFAVKALTKMNGRLVRTATALGLRVIRQIELGGRGRKTP